MAKLVRRCTTSPRRCHRVVTLHSVPLFCLFSFATLPCNRNRQTTFPYEKTSHETPFQLHRLACPNLRGARIARQGHSAPAGGAPCATPVAQRGRLPALALWRLHWKHPWTIHGLLERVHCWTCGRVVGCQVLLMAMVPKGHKHLQPRVTRGLCRMRAMQANGARGMVPLQASQAAAAKNAFKQHGDSVLALSRGAPAPPKTDLFTSSGMKININGH